MRIVDTVGAWFNQLYHDLDNERCLYVYNYLIVH